MAQPFDPTLPDLPTPPSPEDVRAAVLRRDPRAMALAMSGLPNFQTFGRELDASQLARQVQAEQSTGQRFKQAMEGGQEARTRAFGAEELNQGRGKLALGQGQLDVERGKLALERERLQYGRWQPIVGADGITYLYDSLSHRIVNGVVPGAGWSIGGGVPGAEVSPGSAPSGVPVQRSGPGAFSQGAGPGGPGAPLAASHGPPGSMVPPMAGAPAGGPPGSPQGQPQLPPQALAYMEAAARHKMPPEALKELDSADKSEMALRRGLQTVLSRPQAFKPGSNMEENLPFDYPKSVGRAIHAQFRDPQDSAAQAAVFQYAVGAMHDYFGARMTEPEFQRAALFLPSIHDPPQVIQAKLQQALDAIAQYKARVRNTYMPQLAQFSQGQGPAAGAGPAPSAAGAPPAPGAPAAQPAGRTRIPVTRNGVTRYWNGTSWED